MRLPRLLACVLVFLAAGAARGDGQQAPFISIIEPAEWRGDGAANRGIVVRPRRSIRVVGVAFHPTGVTRVEVDGQTARLVPGDAGQVGFTAFVDAGPGPREISIIAFSGGPLVIEQYSVAVDQIERSFDGPSDAFDEVSFSGERYAVIIGISEYEDARIADLRYADDDARSVYDFLTSERAGLGGIPAENVRLLVNEDATLRQIQIALTTFLDQVAEEDVVFVYWAGHGAPDPSRPIDHYLYTYDTDFDAVAATALPAEDLKERVARQRARDVILITDACHAGAVMQGIRGTNSVNQAFLGRLESGSGGWLTFTASEVNQYSQEDQRWGGGHGVFTHFLIEALEGYADSDGDRVVTLGETVEFVRDRVRQETRDAQVPVIGPDGFDRGFPVAVVLDEAIAAANRETEPDAARAPEAAVVQLMSPGATFAQSLLLPGTGQMRTGHTLRGAAVLAGTGGAIAWGLLSTTTTEDCRVTPVGGRCPQDQLIGTSESRPYLIAGLGLAGGLALLGAIDAWRGANAINDERRRIAGGSTFSLSVLPAPRPGTAGRGDLTVLGLTFR